jgi:NAD(P)-dependent dehydrogenase (short-subunit alcohol dehydrogenase family)
VIAAGRERPRIAQEEIFGRVLTKVAAMDYVPHGIRINTSCTGAIDTPFLAALPCPALNGAGRSPTAASATCSNLEYRSASLPSTACRGGRAE